jgi:transcriptional regulator with XRE-family HTH domain
MDRESIGALVRRLRRARRLQQVDLAGLAGVGRSWLSELELDRIARPAPGRLERLAAPLGVDPDRLLSTVDYESAALAAGRPRRRGDAPGKDEIVTESTELVVRRRSEGRCVRLPVRSQASAGGGSPPDVRTVSFEVLPGEVGHRFEAVEVVGDCLEDELRKGEVVVVDLDGSPVPCDIVLAEHDGEWIFKIVERRGDDLFLVAHNDRPALPVDGDRTRILGVALEASRRLARGRARRPG